MELFNNLMEILGDVDSDRILQDLLNGNVECSNENEITVCGKLSTLKMTRLENGFILNYTKSDYNEFEEYCKTIEDDEFFLKVCEHFDENYPGGIKELNDHPTEERINNFKSCVREKALEEISKFKEYYDRASTSNN